MEKEDEILDKWIMGNINYFERSNLDPDIVVGWIGTLLLHALYCAEASQYDVDDFFNRAREEYKKINSQESKISSIQEITEE